MVRFKNWYKLVAALLVAVPSYAADRGVQINGAIYIESDQERGMQLGSVIYEETLPAPAAGDGRVMVISAIPEPPPVLICWARGERPA